MTYILNSEQSSQLDLETLESTDVTNKGLIDRAGRAIAHHIIENIDDPFNKNYLFIAGPGKNGLDAIVANYYMHNYGLSASLHIIGDDPSLQPSAKINPDYLEYVKSVDRIYFSDRQNIDFNYDRSAFDWIVEGIYGSGLNRDIEDIWTINIIKEINAWDNVISIDIPTGILGDTGRAVNVSVQSKETISFGYPKWGHFLSAGYVKTGKLSIYDIGQRWDWDKSSKKPSKIILNNNYSKEYNRNYPRIAESKNKNKRSRGKLLIYGGSDNYSGALFLAAKSALTCGAGIAKVMYDSRLFNTMSSLRESIDIPIKSNDIELTLKEYKQIKEHLDFPDCLLIGPGLSTSTKSLELTRKILQEYKGDYCVIDAGALSAIDYKNDKFSSIPTHSILTPHYGELSRMINIDVNEIRDNTIEVLNHLSKHLEERILVLKGPNTIVVDGQGQMSFIVNGNEKLATAGTGDVLAGMIASYVINYQINIPHKQNIRFWGCLKAASILATYHHAECSNYNTNSKIRATDIISAIGNVKSKIFINNED